MERLSHGFPWSWVAALRRMRSCAPGLMCVCACVRSAWGQSTNTVPFLDNRQSSPAQTVVTNLPPALMLGTEIGGTPPGPQPATGVPGVPPGAGFGGSSQLASGPGLPAEAGPVGPAIPRLFRWGPVVLRPHLDYQLSYGNSLQASPGQQVNSFINALSPGMLAELGRHWTLDYTPTLRFYSDPRLQNETDHAVYLRGSTTYEDWTLGLSQGYVSSSQPLIETAAQTSQETYATALSASRPLSSELSLDLGINQNFLYLDQSVPGEQLTDHQSWSTLDWLNYQVWPRVSVGLGLGFNYDHMAVGPDMTTEQYQGRVVWAPGTKLSLVFSGGLSDMQFMRSDVPDLLSPIFAFSAHYQLFEQTALSVGASRTVSPSYFQSQVSESTGVNAGVSQRLLGRLYLNVSGGYVNSGYHASATGPAVASVSNYDTASFNVSLTTTFLTRASASVFFSQNYISSSGAGAYNYTTTQTGLELSYRY